MRALLVAAALSLIATVAQAAETQPFTAAAFAAAQAVDKPILVDIHAWWCPICAKQAPTIEKLQKSSELADMSWYQGENALEKAVVRQFGAQMQSTLIVFHGKTERSLTGVTDLNNPRAPAPVQELRSSAVRAGIAGRRPTALSPSYRPRCPSSPKAPAHTSADRSRWCSGLSCRSSGLASLSPRLVSPLESIMTSSVSGPR
jgi:hypothetical protein